MEILKREHFNRWYKLGPFIISTLAIEVPFQVCKVSKFGKYFKIFIIKVLNFLDIMLCYVYICELCNDRKFISKFQTFLLLYYCNIDKSMCSIMGILYRRYNSCKGKKRETINIYIICHKT